MTSPSAVSTLKEWATSYLPSSAHDILGTKPDGKAQRFNYMSLTKFRFPLENIQATDSFVDKVLGMEEETNILFLAHHNSFYVWSLSNGMKAKPQLLAAEDSSPPVQCLHILSVPSTVGAFSCTSDGNILQDSDTPAEIIPLEKRPLLAVVAKSDWNQYNTNAVYLYSMVSQKYIHTLTFPEQVLQVDSNSFCAVVGTTRAVYVLDSISFRRIFVVFRDECKPGFLPSPLKISSRWLAVSGAIRKKAGSGLQASSTVDEWSLVGSARGIEKGVEFLAGVTSVAYAWTAETVSQGYAKYTGKVDPKNSEQPRESKAINNDEDSVAEAESISGAHAHEVIIIDIHPDANGDVDITTPSITMNGNNTKSYGSQNLHGNSIKDNIVMHLQAYAQGLAIASMAWSRSGDMIAIAPQDARTVSVYAIYPAKMANRRVLNAAPQLMYQCQRGLTRAVVSNLGFSDDNRWLYMSTERGTSHIFAINRPKISPTAFIVDENATEGIVKSVVSPVPASPQTHCDDSIVGDTKYVVNDQKKVTDYSADGSDSIYPGSVDNGGSDNVMMIGRVVHSKKTHRGVVVDTLNEDEGVSASAPGAMEMLGNFVRYRFTGTDHENDVSLPGYLKDLKAQNESSLPTYISCNPVGRIYHYEECKKYLDGADKNLKLSNGTSESTRHGGSSAGDDDVTRPPATPTDVTETSGPITTSQRLAANTTTFATDENNNIVVMRVLRDGQLTWSVLKPYVTKELNEVNMFGLNIIGGGGKMVPFKPKIEPSRSKMAKAILKKMNAYEHIDKHASDVSKDLSGMHVKINPDELLSNAEMKTHVPYLSSGQQLPLWAVPGLSMNIMTNTRRTSRSYAIPWWWKVPIQSKQIKQKQLGPLPENVMPLPTAPVLEYSKGNFDEVLKDNLKMAKEGTVFT